MKSPLNVLVGKCLSETRKNLGFTDDLVVSNALRVTTSHWRLIESGWIPCPISATHTLADLMSWDFARLAEILAGVGHADAKLPKMRDIDIASVRDRLEELSRLPGDQKEMWEWCRDQLPKPSSNDDEGDEPKEDIDVMNSPGFDDRMQKLLNYLDNLDSAKQSKGETVESEAGGDTHVPLYFRSILNGMRSSLQRTEFRLRNAVPVINGEEGFNVIYADYRKDIRSCEAFLNYTPEKEAWEKSSLDFHFLWNRHSPTSGQDCKILLFTKDAQDLTKRETAINKVFQKSRPKNIEETKCISINPRKDFPLHQFAYNFATREVGLVVADDLSSRSDDEILLHNAWFFDVGPYGMFCTLDNYVAPTNGQQASPQKVYSISLDGITAGEFRDELRDVAT